MEWKLKVLPYHSAQKYLGRQFSFQDPSKKEVESRIAAGWRKFFLLKRELTTKTYSLKGRLRLFHGTVTPTVLYACNSWTLTVELENRLRRTQRQMLRMILGTPRRRQHNPTSDAQWTDPTFHKTNNPMDNHIQAMTHETTPSTDSDSDAHDADSDTPETIIPIEHTDDTLEPWIDWIRRSTREVETIIESLGIEDWISQHRRQKWQWAQRVATETFKLTYQVAMWDPSLDPKSKARRQAARPRRRWTDDIVQHLAKHNLDETHWTNVAKNVKTWKDLEESYVKRQL